MRFFLWAMLAAVLLGAASCGSSAPPQGSGADHPAMTTSDGASTPQAAPGPRAGASAAAAKNANRLEGEAPSAGARFTIYCTTVRGPAHVIRAAQLKDELLRTTGLSGWHIIHTEEQSSIFYGYYRTFDDKANDPAEAARAQADIKRINALKDGNGDRMFRGTLFLSIDEPDPEAPREWDLANAPAGAFWSLQIAAYRGSPERKKAAVDSVREARKMGIEAYYYHGESISSVCIGAWPRSAVKEQDSDHARSTDPDSPVLVVNSPLPPLAGPVRDRSGNTLTVMAPKLEVIDKTLAKAIRDYPDHAINDEVHAKVTATGDRINDCSFLVIIPGREESPAVASPDMTPPGGASTGADSAAGAIIDSPPAQQPAPGGGYGHLRSIDR